MKYSPMLKLESWRCVPALLPALVACAVTPCPPSSPHDTPASEAAAAPPAPSLEAEPAGAPATQPAGSHQHGPHTHQHDAGTRLTHPGEARVTPHDSLKSFSNNGNTLRGIATPSSGATSYEVWRTSVAVGSQTPPHSHESEEVFIFLTGKGKAKIGDREFDFEAPATVVAPSNVPHQFFNTGDVPTDAIVVVGVGSKIWDQDGREMNLPWRK